MEMDPGQLRQIVQDAVQAGINATDTPLRREFERALGAQCEKTELQFKMTNQRFASNEKALEKAEQNMERRLTDINAGQLATKTELGIAVTGLNEKIADIITAAGVREGGKRITDWLIMTIIAALTVGLFKYLGW
jgi:hypothetical protein